MYTVYALYSEKFGKIYIGFTSSIDERFKSHNKLSKKGWTIKFRPWMIIYKEEHLLKKDALVREKTTKICYGKGFY